MNNPVKFTLFSVYYKPFGIPNIPYIRPIQAGRALYDDLGMEVDNEGENISDLNHNFVELTALYNIWKKYKQTDFPYFGLCHYRRYPTHHLSWNRFKEVYFLKANDETFNKVFTPKLEHTISKKLAEGYIILPKPHVMYRLKRWNVKLEYWKAHDKEAWFAMEAAIQKLSPEYITSFHTFAAGSRISLYNIMIASWEFWDGYLSWMFPILFEVKKHYTISEDVSQRRVFGFLSERLLSTYVLHHKTVNKQKVLYMPIAHFS